MRAIGTPLFGLDGIFARRMMAATPPSRTPALLLAVREV